MSENFKSPADICADPTGFDRLVRNDSAVSGRVNVIHRGVLAWHPQHIIGQHRGWSFIGTVKADTYEDAINPPKIPTTLLILSKHISQRFDPTCQARACLLNENFIVALAFSDRKQIRDYFALSDDIRHTDKSKRVDVLREELRFILYQSRLDCNDVREQLKLLDVLEWGINHILLPPEVKEMMNIHFKSPIERVEVIDDTPDKDIGDGIHH